MTNHTFDRDPEWNFRPSSSDGTTTPLTGGGSGPSMQGPGAGGITCTGAHAPEGYETLAAVLACALDQAAEGKGKERHAQSDTPFHKQPMCEIARMVGVGYQTGQAMKKTQEAMRLPAGKDEAELLGAINYLAGAVIILREERGVNT